MSHYQLLDVNENVWFESAVLAVVALRQDVSNWVVQMLKSCRSVVVLQVKIKIYKNSAETLTTSDTYIFLGLTKTLILLLQYGVMYKLCNKCYATMLTNFSSYPSYMLHRLNSLSTQTILVRKEPWKRSTQHIKHAETVYIIFWIIVCN